MRHTLKLEIHDVATEFFAHTHIFGIVAHLADYQFCWHLNQMLDLDFRKSTDTEIQIDRKKREYYFSLYEYQIPSTQIMHYLYNNKYEGDFLLPEFKNFDFIWLIKSDEDDFEQINLTEIMRSINSLPQVQIMVEIPLAKIKSKTNLIF